MNQINLSMTSIEVIAETRALRCEWTREMTQDLKSYHGINVDDLEREIIRGMRRDNRKKSIKNIFHN